MMPIKYVKSYNIISVFYHNRHALLYYKRHTNQETEMEA